MVKLAILSYLRHCVPLHVDAAMIYRGLLCGYGEVTSFFQPLSVADRVPCANGHDTSRATASLRSRHVWLLQAALGTLADGRSTA